MAVVTTTQLDTSFQERLQAEFIIAMRRQYIYSQGPFVWTPPGAVIGLGARASSVVIPLYGELKPVPTAISQTADITPVSMYDAVVSVAPDLYGNAVQLSQKVQLISVPEVIRVASEEVAMNAAETRDYLARSQAIGGSVFAYGGDATDRTSLSTASTADTITLAKYLQAVSFLEGTRCPKLPGPGAGFAAIMRKSVVADTILDSNIVLVAEYGDAYNQGAQPSLLMGEIGTHVAGVRIIESNFAKVWAGGGSSYGGTGTTMSSAMAAGSTTGLTLAQSTASMGGAAVGCHWTLGTRESTGTEYADTETIMITGSTGSAPTFIGGDPNGGTLYAHSSGDAVNYDRPAHAVVFMGANALMMAYTNEDGLGPDGIIYPPDQVGILKQFTNVGWKGFWGFGRVSQGRLFRLEVATNYPTIGK